MIKFGLSWGFVTFHGSWAAVRNVAVEAEKLGYESLWINDHFYPPPCPDQPFLECWTTLSALTQITSRIRLGALVTCALYRQPTVLAKMAATIDHMSDGRLEFGIGGGWQEREFEAYGFKFPSIKERAEQLAEAVAIIKKMWTEDKANFDGKFYKASNALCSPKPVQQPHPPIWIAGKYRRILELACVEADGWNGGTIQESKDNIKKLDETCKALGRAPNTLRKSLQISVILDDSPGKAERKTLELQKKLRCPELRAISPNEFLARMRKLGVVGTPEEFVDTIQDCYDRGIERFILVFPDMEELTPLRHFSKEVLPRFKKSLVSR